MAKDFTFGASPEHLKRLLFAGLDEVESDKDVRSPASPADSMEGPGAKIGHYRLVRSLGEGGMGIVYLAEQEHPIKRQVALKIIKPGMDTKAVIARIEAERQALALLDHPNIAHIYDAGTTAGRPYFAMEYIQGVPIVEHCDQQKLTIEQRLQLFLGVCEAIQHAHQKGIIHRDIKPSNILVHMEGAKPVPKVIDFGIAKAMSQALTERTLVTEQGHFVGTPEYMSPEQAQASGQDTDTRSDIYSLGVVLYELLAGVLPFDPKALREGGPDHARQVIREEEPKTPSKQLTALGKTAEAVAANRQTEVHALTRRLHRELEWIPLKAMRKDPARRYRSASELADDIRNYLDGHPLIAGPETVTYRVRKFVRRNRVIVGAGAAVGVVLALGIVGSMWQAVRATQAEREQGRERQRAEQSEQKETEARKQAEAQAYSAEMNLAHHAYAEGKVGRALALLEKHIPASRSQEDLRGFEWRYLWRLCQEGDALHTFRAHTTPVRAIAFSGGDRLVTCSSEGVVRIFDIATKQEVASHQMQETVNALAAPVTGDQQGSRVPNEVVADHVAISANGKAVAAAFANGTVKSWKVATWEDSTIIRHNGPIRSLALSPDTRTLAIADANSIRFGDCAKEGKSATFPWTKDISTLVFSPNGNLLMGSSGGTHLGFWIVAEKRELEPLQAAHTSRVGCSAFSPNGQMLATGSWDTTIKVWDFASRRLLGTLLGHRSFVNAVAFSPDGRTLVSGSSDGTVKLWDVDTWSQVTLKGHTNEVVSLAFSPDGKILASGSADGTVKLWSAERRQSPDVMQGHTDWVFTLAFSPDDQTLATAGFDGTIRMWDWRTGAVITQTPVQANDFFTVAFSPDGKMLATGEGLWRGARFRERTDSPAARLWNVADLSEAISLPGYRSPNANRTYDVPDGVRAVAFSPDGMTLASGDWNGLVKLWSLPSTTEIVSFSTSGCITGIQFSPDGKFFAAATGAGARLWITATRKLTACFEDRPNLGWGAPIAFSPDSKLFAIGSDRVILWNLMDQEELAILEGHGGPIMCVCFSPDGRTLATGSIDHSVRLWSLATLQEVATLEGHTGPVSGLAFSSDGTALASCSEDKTIRLWRAISPSEAERVKGAKIK
jgi:eukaryotic-like serine/threonine-protein kinase